MTEHFIGEPIEPITDTADSLGMASGGPGLPREFIWRGRTYKVLAVLRTWRETGPCSHGSPEMYVRKHWFEIETDSGETMRIYFDRQPRPGKKGQRWWLFTMDRPDKHGG